MKRVTRTLIIMAAGCLLGCVLLACAHSPVVNTAETESGPAATASGGQPPSSSAALAAIAAIPDRVSVDKDSNRALMIIATYANGAKETVTARCGFASGDRGIAQVTIGGLVQGVQPGATVVTVSYTENGVTKTTTVPVTVVTGVVPWHVGTN